MSWGFCPRAGESSRAVVSAHCDNNDKNEVTTLLLLPKMDLSCPNSFTCISLQWFVFNLMNVKFLLLTNDATSSQPWWSAAPSLSFVQWHIPPITQQTNHPLLWHTKSLEWKQCGLLVKCVIQRSFLTCQLERCGLLFACHGNKFIFVLSVKKIISFLPGNLIIHATSEVGWPANTF